MSQKNFLRLGLVYIAELCYIRYNEGGETMRTELFTIIVKNGANCIIDSQIIEAYDGSEALAKYIKDYKPILEKDDTIEIK